MPSTFEIDLPQTLFECGHDDGSQIHSDGILPYIFHTCRPYKRQAFFFFLAHTLVSLLFYYKV
jgi:hypothetical protein